ncbi:lipase [Colletotrichum graminicola M1.001]|uniref:Lipase n=1 Tax=Colletotrichum graminicola (strain M1.001 / M2 / FGSC 10212) TaxID=645133 RepID=E3QZS1_COLGM|nr:lipase [Colletotrichum graminicola M1.001]EFQ36359.1 lipase [Colletotrichum graminicola M1.001]
MRSVASSGGAISGAVTPDMMNNFHTFIQYTAAAYCNSDPLQTSTSISCTNDACPLIQTHDTHIVTALDITEGQDGGYIALDNTAKTIVVAFHGSSNVGDWITNLDVGLVDSPLCSGCKVHKGFQDSWSDIQQTVMAIVPGLRSVHADYNIVTTGHSLGAALATLSAAQLRQSMGIPIDTYLYGSPRIGNEDFVEFFNGLPGQTFRVTHWDDPVPRLPGHQFGYYHVDTEYWLSVGGADKIDYTPEEVLVCQGSYNTNCNSGTQFTNLDLDAHYRYFQRVAACKA